MTFDTFNFTFLYGRWLYFFFQFSMLLPFMISVLLFVATLMVTTVVMRPFFLFVLRLVNYRELGVSFPTSFAIVTLDVLGFFLCNVNAVAMKPLITLVTAAGITKISFELLHEVLADNISFFICKDAYIINLVEPSLFLSEDRQKQYTSSSSLILISNKASNYYSN